MWYFNIHCIDEVEVSKKLSNLFNVTQISNKATSEHSSGFKANNLLAFFMMYIRPQEQALGEKTTPNQEPNRELVFQNLIYSKLLLFFYFKGNAIYLFIYLWLCWVFVSMRGLPLVAASGVHSSSRHAGLSLSRPLLLWSTGSRRAGSVVVAHGPSCPAACGIFPDQGSNPRPPHWQADSQPLRHQGSPIANYF